MLTNLSQQPLISRQVWAAQAIGGVVGLEEKVEETLPPPTPSQKCLVALSVDSVVTVSEAGGRVVKVVDDLCVKSI